MESQKLSSTFENTFFVLQLASDIFTVSFPSTSATGLTEWDKGDSCGVACMGNQGQEL